MFVCGVVSSLKVVSASVKYGVVVWGVVSFKVVGVVSFKVVWVVSFTVVGVRVVVSGTFSLADTGME